MLLPCVGEIGFSAALEELSSSLFNGKLPPAWARLNPATEKPLGPWMAWFTRRHEQYKVKTTLQALGAVLMPRSHAMPKQTSFVRLSCITWPCVWCRVVVHVCLQLHLQAI